MTFSGLGDLARYFASSRASAEIRSRLDNASVELSTGLKTDPARNLAGDLDRVPDVLRSLELVGRQTTNARLILDRLDAMQSGLDNVRTIGSALLSDLSALSQSAGNEWRDEVSRLGQAAIEDVVATLNSRFAGASLFAGRAEDTRALAPVGDILSAIRLEVAGATSVVDVLDEIEDWFSSPAGGFDVIAYSGDTGPLSVRRIDDFTTVDLNARADDPAIRSVLKGIATAILANDPSLVLSDAERDEIVSLATAELFGSSTLLSELQGRLGNSQSRVESALVRLQAQEGGLDLMRNGLLASDPFEAATSLEQLQAKLETHYTVTARLSQLSLTRYL